MYISGSIRLTRGYEYGYATNSAFILDTVIRSIDPRNDRQRPRVWAWCNRGVLFVIAIGRGDKIHMYKSYCVQNN